MTVALPGFQKPTTETLTLRYYQHEAILAAYEFLRNRADNPCIVLPTGAGKTPVMASVCNDAVTRWGGRVLVLSHVKELIEQTAVTLASWFPGLSVGVYSAGLRRRDRRSDVLVAGIQSVHRRGLELAGARPFNLVLVDEAHRIPTSGDGMYRRLLGDLKVASPMIRVIGLTATPYRLKGGYVCSPDHFLNEICYEAGVRELIAKGYLSALVSKQSQHSVDDSMLGIRNGEFKSEDLETAFDNSSVIDSAVAEIAQLTATRRSVLLFCCGVEHADHVASCVANVTGQRCGLITGETPAEERDRTVEAFKSGELKYLANVNVLTEGFDARCVDCVCLLRSTLSPGLYYQMVGRGLRTHPGKTDCLVLDFGGNVLRHGCVDAIQVTDTKNRGGGGGEAPAKVCEQCASVCNAAYARCPECGEEFPPPEDTGPRHNGQADEVPITSDQVPSVRWEVTSVEYCEHIKKGADETAPRTMRVSYFNGLDCICDEWVCIEHSGWAGEKASLWWSQRSTVPMPDSSEHAARLARAGVLTEPVAICVRQPPGARFPEIARYEMGPMPQITPEDLEAFDPNDDPFYDDSEVPF